MSTETPLRRKLRKLAEEIPALIEVAHERTPLWRGIVYSARRKCGKPGCRCARGGLHVSTVLADRSGPKQRNFSLPGPREALFRRLTEDYRRVRQARARWVKLAGAIAGLFDRLEEVRRKDAVRRHAAKLSGRSEEVQRRRHARSGRFRGGP